MEAGTTTHATVMSEHVIQESEAWTKPSLQRKHRGPGIGGTPAQGRDEKKPRRRETVQGQWCTFFYNNDNCKGTIKKEEPVD